MSAYPVVINSFNQPTYLRSMVSQLLALNVARIVIIDHNSTNEDLHNYLDTICKYVTIIKLRENLGPHWFFMEGLALAMPEFFAYTDADLLFNECMPRDFISQMVDIGRDLKAAKVGLALDISKSGDLLTFQINIGGKTYTNIDWERQFWTKRAQLRNYELYEAPVDTTFAVYQRSEFDKILKKYIYDGVYDSMDTPGSYRLAGDFSAVHLPWSRSDPMPRDELDQYVATRINVHKY